MNTSSFLAIGLGWPEIVMILVIVLVLFGAKKIPELAKGLGHGIKEFKKATKDVQDDLQRAIEDDPAPTPTLPRRTDTVATSPDAPKTPSATTTPSQS